MSGIDTSNQPPYDLSFLEQIVNVSWPNKGKNAYLLVSITAQSGSNASSPGPPSITFGGLTTSKNGPTLLDTESSFNVNPTPASTITTRAFYLWDPEAPSPTTTTFGDNIGLFDSFGTVGYGQQFNSLYRQTAAVILEGYYDPISGKLVFLTPLPPFNISTLAAAETCVNAYNAFLNNLGLGDGPYFHSYWLDQQPLKASAPVSGRGLLQVNELDYVTTIPASYSAKLVAHYLIKVPAQSTITVSVTTPGTVTSTFIEAGVFTSQTQMPTKIPQLNGNGQFGGGAAAEGSSAGNGNAGYQITTDATIPDVQVTPFFTVPHGPSA